MFWYLQISSSPKISPSNMFLEPYDSGGNHAYLKQQSAAERRIRFWTLCWTHGRLPRWQLGPPFCLAHSRNGQFCFNMDEFQCSPRWHFPNNVLADPKQMQWQPRTNPIWATSQFNTDTIQYVCYFDQFSFTLANDYADQQNVFNSQSTGHSPHFPVKQEFPSDLLRNRLSFINNPPPQKKSYAGQTTDQYQSHCVRENIHLIKRWRKSELTH